MPKTKHIVVFETGRLFEIDMVRNAMKEAGIPHFTQQQMSSGLKVAMPAAPAPGPGTWWNLLVPSNHVEHAKEILSQLPLGPKTGVGVWDFGPKTRKIKRGFKFYAIIILIITFLIILRGIILQLLQ